MQKAKKQLKEYGSQFSFTQLSDATGCLSKKSIIRLSIHIYRLEDAKIAIRDKSILYLRYDFNHGGVVKIEGGKFK